MKQEIYAERFSLPMTDPSSLVLQPCNIQFVQKDKIEFHHPHCVKGNNLLQETHAELFSPPLPKRKAAAIAALGWGYNEKVKPVTPLPLIHATFTFEQHLKDYGIENNTN